MSVTRPTIVQLVSRAETEIKAALPGADAPLKRTVLGILAKVHADAIHGLYGYLDCLAKQVLPDSAEADHLDRHASIWGITRRPATFASGPVMVTGTDGVSVPKGTVLGRTEKVRYITVAEVTLVGGTATVDVVAGRAGANSSMAEGRTLTLAVPVAGVNGTATVAAGGLTGGADEENDAGVRARILERIQDPPHGGKSADYVKWAKAVPVVTRAWVYAQELGIGTVTVRFMMDDAYDDGIPRAVDVKAVQDHIDLNRPLGADVTVVAPVPVPLNLDILGLGLAPEAVRNAVTAGIKDLISREAEPGSTLLISHIRKVISGAAPKYDPVLVSPVANVTHSTGRIAVPGTITWS